MNRPFEAWELATRVALGDRGIDHHAATPLIDAAQAHCAQSGQDPWEAHGSPAEFAAAASAEHPVSLIAGRDIHGLTPGDHLTGAAFTLALVAVPSAVFAIVVRGGFTVPLTVAGLVGTALFAVCWFMVQGVPGALRAAGRPRLAPWAYAVAAALAVAAGFAFTRLSTARVGSVPVLGVIALAVVAAWLLTRTGRAPRPAVARPDRADPDAAEDWLGRLNGLLIGRFDVPAGRAGELVDEARGHLAAAGGSPRDEFGPVDEYAYQLASGEADHRGPFWRSALARLIVRTAVTAVVAQMSIAYWGEGRRWIAVLAAVAALAGAWSVAGMAGRYVRERRRVRVPTMS